MKKTLDTYWFLFVYYGVLRDKKISNSLKKGKKVNG